ncbi:MAG: gamma-glutamyltransferase [Rhodospirillales bacterium]|nr:gamma-glutamyltransferase [Rhodospirillales bacterium]
MRSRVSAEAERSVGNVRTWRLYLTLLLLGALVGCGGPGKRVAVPPPAPVFFGAVVSPERLAGEVARQVLADGGDAADAAVALGFALAVSLPSRAGLGGGGACLAYEPAPAGPGRGRPEAILFLPKAPAGGAVGDRPAAVPMLARGLYLLHARYGRLPIRQLVGEAQKMARLGIPVSAPLAQDLSAVAGPLLADPAARAVFAGPSGAPLAAGQTLFQPELANTLSELRLNGVGDFYQGPLARRLAAAASVAGGGLAEQDFTRAVPAIGTPIELRAGVNSVAFLPPPADGGLAAAAAFADLWRSPQDLAGAAGRALAIAARWRAGGVTAEQLLGTKTLVPASLPPLPASAAFAALDSAGGAVACAVTMNNLFGTGRIAPGTGVLLAAAPGTEPLPLLSAGIAWNNNIHAFRAAVAGSGQNAAAIAVGLTMADTLRSRTLVPVAVPPPGVAQMIACGHFLPGNAASCGAAADPPGAGFALISRYGGRAGGS